MYERSFQGFFLFRAVARQLLIAGLIAGAGAVQASKPKNIEESEMKLAPAYCRDTQGFGYGDAYSNTSPRAGHWIGLMGNSF